MPFTNNELEIILYTLEGYLQSTDDDKYGDELVRICDKIIQELPPIVINLPEGTNLKKVVRTETNNSLDLQKLVKDYPRDGFSLFLLPFLLLEAITKEGLKLVNF